MTENKKTKKKGVFEKLKRNLKAMKSLLKADPAKRKQILKEGTNELITCLVDSAINVLKGNVPLTSCQYKALKRRKKLIRALADPKTGVHLKRGLLIKQKGSGFFLPLLAAVLPAITSLIAR